MPELPPTESQINLAQELNKYLHFSTGQIEIAQEVARDIKMGKVTNNPHAFLENLRYRTSGSPDFRARYPQEYRRFNLFRLTQVATDDPDVEVYVNSDTATQLGGPEDGSVVRKLHFIVIRKDHEGKFTLSSPQEDQRVRYEALALRQLTPPLQEPPTWAVHE